MSTQKDQPGGGPDRQPAPEAADEEPGSNAVEHEPDPKAKPIPDGEPKYVPRSPFTTGND